MKAAICTEKLNKWYGKQRGVIDLDLVVQPGEVFGYLGPNGAGKTTTIRMLLGLIKPTSGRAELFGKDVQHDSLALRRRIGYLPGELAMYDKLTGKELLAYFAHLRGGVHWPFVNQLAERLGVDLTRRIRTLSKGNKQKVGLVQAFMHQPDILILDEPTSGLDPLVQHEFNDMVQEAKTRGCTVFLSSHVLAEVEALADRVGIIREGQLVSVDEISDLKAKALRQLKLEFGYPVPVEAFENLPNVQDVRMTDCTLQCAVAGSVDRLIKVAAQFEVVNITSHTPDLEGIFMEFYKGDISHAA